jgi:hypothetical protein
MHWSLPGAMRTSRVRRRVSYAARSTLRGVHRSLGGTATSTHCAPGSPLPEPSVRMAAVETAPAAQYRRRHGRLITTIPGASLTGTDLHHWIALRRVFDGEVTRLDGCWRDHGHLVPRYVMDALNELLTGGLVMIRVDSELTDAGTARFEQLCKIALGLPAA